jgi:hypothetical protein
MCMFCRSLFVFWNYKDISEVRIITYQWLGNMDLMLPDHSLSWYTCTWPLTFLIHMYLTTHFPGLIQALQVSGQVHAYQESEWSGTCVLGVLILSLFLRLFYLILFPKVLYFWLLLYIRKNMYLTTHFPDTHVPDHSLSWYACTWPLTFLIHMYLTTHVPDTHVPDHSLSWYTCTFSKLS